MREAQQQHHIYPPVRPIPCIYPIPFMPYYVKLAHAYVPYQYYQTPFPIDMALDKGTYFPELYQPYVQEKCKRGDISCQCQ